MALLALVTALVWASYYDRWTLASWRIPTDYSGDTLEILARIEAAAEGDAAPLRPQIISRLGAPFGANWSAYPSSDLLLLAALGRLADVVGVYPTANLALLLAAVTSALSFYGCARWLRTRWEWAFAGAVLFAFTFQTFHRGLAHLFLQFTWKVPVALLACGLVASSRRLRLREWSGFFCVATAAAIGVGNPYTLFLFMQLLGWALVAQWLGPRRRENLVTGLVAAAVAVGAFFAVESHVWLFAHDTAAASPLVRNYGGTEQYALKPLELFMPPSTHRWEALAFFGKRYLRWSDWRGGEAFSPYLGLVGIAGIVWLAVVVLRAILRGRQLPGIARPASWVLVFASVGGVTNIVAFFTGLILFRATNRYSVFLSAIALLFLMGRMTRWWRGRPAWLSVTAAAAVAAVGLADELPRAPGPAQQRETARRVAADEDLGNRLEDALPTGAMVFQLPVLMFPEAAPVNELGAYEPFRPYLATDSLRFSYGPLRGRSRGRWQRDIESLPTAELVQRLEQSGFSALYLNRLGFLDHGEKLLRELTALGRTRRIVGPAGNQVCVLLQPASRPRPPLARTLTFGTGWNNPKSGEPRWAYGAAALSYFNPYRRPLPVEVRFVLSGVNRRRVRLSMNGVEKFAGEFDANPREVRLQLVLRPGINRFDLESEEPAIRLSDDPGQLRSFAVHDVGVDTGVGPNLSSM